MLCQNCQKRPANVHFTQVTNSKKTELYLCDQCAREKGQTGLGSPINISDLLSGLMNFGSGGTHAAKEAAEEYCEICGMSFEDFRKTGKMGCSNCYRIFGDRLKPIMKRLHGNTEHTGKVPDRYAGRSGHQPPVAEERGGDRPSPAAGTDNGGHRASAENARPPAAGEMTKIEELKLSLEKAVKAEEYEKAAEIRDRIRQLEGAK